MLKTSSSQFQLQLRDQPRQQVRDQQERVEPPAGDAYEEVRARLRLRRDEERRRRRRRDHVGHQPQDRGDPGRGQ